MIEIPEIESEEQLILERSRLFVGCDEARMSQSWLDNEGAYAVPFENITDLRYNGTDSRFGRACAVYPDSTWCAVRTSGGARGISTPRKISSPATDVHEHVISDGTLSWLAGEFPGGSFLFFSLEYPAAILFSVYDFALVTGDEKFVESYFNEGVEEALQVFHDEWAAELALCDTRRPSQADSVRRYYATAWSQARLPPDVTVPEGVMTI